MRVMDNDSIKTWLLLLAGFGICAVVYWLLGKLKHKIVSLRSGRTSLDALFLDWTVRAARLGVWLLFFVFFTYLIPRARVQFDTVGDRLGACTRPDSWMAGW